MIWFCPQWVLLCRYLQLVSLCLVALTVAYGGPTSPTDSKGAPSGRPEFGKAAPTAAASLSVPPDLLSARVVRVVDGDTADVDLVGQAVRLRLIGMDTPETVDPRTSVQCFDREASAKAKEMIEVQTVHLDADLSQDERDSFGRLLRYVWLGEGRRFNLEMVAGGFAHEDTFRAPHKYPGQFRAAQAEAREQERGLWSPQTCGGNTEQPVGRAAAPAVPAATTISATATPRPAGAAATMVPAPKTGDCGSIPHRDFRVLPPDPHRFDGDQDGVGCESTSRSR